MPHDPALSVGARAASERGPTGRLRRAREILGQGGVRLLAIKMLGETLYRWQVLVALDLRSPPVFRSRLALAFSWLGESDVQEFAAFHPHASREDVAARLARGERCLVVRHRERLVAAVWATSAGGPIHDREPWPRISSDEVYVYDAYTAPAYRGWGAYPALTAELAAVLAAEGYARMVGTVRTDADHALRAHALAGYRRFGTVGRIVHLLPRELQIVRTDPQDTGWRSERLDAIDLRGGAPAWRSDSALEFEDLEEDGMDEYLALRPAARREDVTARLARGERCVLAVLDGCVVGAAWVATRGPYDPALGMWVRLLRGEAYVYEEFTLPEHRPTDVGRALRERVLGELERAGFERALVRRAGQRLSGERRLGRLGTIALRGSGHAYVLTRRAHR